MSGFTATVRKMLSDRIARLIDFRIDLQLQESRRRLDHADERFDEQRKKLDWHGACITDHRRRLDEVEGKHGWTKNELERVIPQVAAQEAQLQTLREMFDEVPVADDEQTAKARSLIDEIRHEHAQIRVRLTGIAQYEDRLRALEEQLAKE